MPTSTKLPEFWPPVARDILLDACYHREMKAPWPVPDVIMRRRRQLDAEIAQGDLRNAEVR